MYVQQKQENQFLIELPKVKIVLGRIEFILKKCEGRKVLHLGCVDEKMTSKKVKEKTLTHFRLLEIAREVWGIDISAKGIELLKGMGIDNLFQGNVENIDEMDVLKGQNFDVILATEILEHLDNPGLFLQGVKGLFSPSTIMIITVPNAFQFTAFEYGLRGYELGHPDHNFCFSYMTLSHMLIKNNYKITEILAYSNIDWETSILVRITRKIKDNLKRIIFKKNDMKHKEISIEMSNSFKNIGGNFREVLKILVRRFLFKLNPFFADGIIFIVKNEDI